MHLEDIWAMSCWKDIGTIIQGLVKPQSGEGQCSIILTKKMLSLLTCIMQESMKGLWVMLKSRKDNLASAQHEEKVGL